MLSELMPYNRGLGSVDAVNGDALDALVNEVFPSGTMAYSDFLKLLRGDFQQAKNSEGGLLGKCSCLWRCCKSSRGSSDSSVSEPFAPPGRNGTNGNSKSHPANDNTKVPSTAVGKPAVPTGQRARTAV